jgi:hypothetical protein
MQPAAARLVLRDPQRAPRREQHLFRPGSSKCARWRPGLPVFRRGSGGTCATRPAGGCSARARLSDQSRGPGDQRRL